MEHDSNKLIQREIDMGGIGELSDKLNELLDLRKKEKNEYRKKEELIADTYTNLSHDIRTPLTSLDGYFQLSECKKLLQHFIKAVKPFSDYIKISPLVIYIVTFLYKLEIPIQRCKRCPYIV